MANSGTIKGSAAGNGNYLYIEWSESNVNTANNTSKVTATVKLYNAYGSYSSGDACAWYVIINGTKISGTIYNWSGNPVTVGSGSATVTHNSNGSKSITISAYFDTAGTSTGAVSASGTATLTNIPRYATSVQSVASKTETSISINWSSDSTCDYIWYSTNNGSSWKAVGSVNSSSGSYSITGLSANTAYKVKTRVRRKDSQLTTDSAVLSISTYAYPYCSNAPKFSIGENPALTIYNPLTRSITVTVSVGTTTLLTKTITGTSINGLNTAAIQDALYSAIPNAKSGTYSVTVKYSSNTATATGTFEATASSAPTIGSAAYSDANTSVTNITKNNKKIIPGKSKITFTASNLSVKNHASISSVKVNVNGTDYTMTVSGTTATVTGVVITSKSQSAAVVTITDSRGFTGTKNISLDIVDYAAPTVTATATRVSGFYSNTEVTPTANYTYIGDNAITIRFQARKTSASTYSVNQIIPDSTKTTISLDNKFPWYCLLTVTDSFGESGTFSMIVSKGMPLFYFDIVKQSVSVNMFPSHDNAFEVDGDIHITVNTSATSGTDYDLKTVLTNLGWEDLLGG